MHQPPPNTNPLEQLKELSVRVPFWVRRLSLSMGPAAIAFQDDIAQETLTRAFNSLPRFDPTKGSISAWLFTITYRTARDMLQREIRHEKHAGSRDVERVPDPQDGERRIIAEFEKRLVHETLQEMKEPLREILEVCELGGLTLREAAEVLGVSARTAWHRLKRAQKDIAQRIKAKMQDRDESILPIPLGGLLAFLRAEVDGISEELPAHRMADVSIAKRRQMVDVEGGALQRALRPIGVFALGGAAGAVGGGLLVYWLMQPVVAPRSVMDPAAMYAAVELPANRVEPRGMVMARPRLPSIPWSISGNVAIASEARSAGNSLAWKSEGGSTIRPNDVEEEKRQARAILDWAVHLLKEGDIGKAKAALSQHDKRFPANPLPILRTAVVRQIEAAGKNRLAP